MSTVYVIAAEGGPVKVGKATNPALRLAQLSTGTPFRLKLVHSENAEGLDALRVERLAHSLLQEFRIHGEWFQVAVEQAVEAVRTAADRLRNPVLPPEFERAKNAMLASGSGMTPAQCRAARALLDWSRDEIAAASKIALRTIVDFERGARSPRHATLDVLRRAFEAAGVEFIPENGGGAGVRLRKKGTESTV